MKYILFEKVTLTGYPALYCKVKGQHEDSYKCIRLFLIAPHSLLCCNPNPKFLLNAENRSYFFDWLQKYETPLINKNTTRYEKHAIIKILEKTFQNKLK